MATARINMHHGFMKSIIRNQVDRDNYDKEVKAKHETASTRIRQTRRRQKKPEMQMYVPPCLKKENRHQLFILEFEDRNGLIHTVDVYKDDTAENLAQLLGERCSMKDDYISALSSRIQQEMDKRS